MNKMAATQDPSSTRPTTTLPKYNNNFGPQSTVNKSSLLELANTQPLLSIYTAGLGYE